MLWPWCSELNLHWVQINPRNLQWLDKQTKFNAYFSWSFLRSHRGYLSLSAVEMVEWLRLYLILIYKILDPNQDKAYIWILNKSLGQFYWGYSLRIFKFAPSNNFKKSSPERVTLQSSLSTTKPVLQWFSFNTITPP